MNIGSPGDKGAFSELVACAWLLEQGYQVFRNVSPNGPYDLIAIKGSEELRIDVRTIRSYDGTGRYPKPNWRLKSDALILYVDPTLKCCAFAVPDLQHIHDSRKLA